MDSAPPSGLPPIPPNIAFLAGPPILGIILDAWLYGLLTAQFFFYLYRFPNDIKFIRTVVILLFLLETVQVIFSIADAFHWYVFGYGDVNKLSDFFLSNIDTPIMGSIVSFTVQVICCWRAHVLSGWRWWPAFISLCALFQATNGILAGSMNQHVSKIFLIPAIELKLVVPFWLGASAATDVMIASTLVYLVINSDSWKHKKTRGMLLRVVILTMETNSLTAIFAVATLICGVIVPSLKPPKTSIFMCFCFLIGKLYSNSYLMMLNLRAFLPEGEGGGEYDTTNPSMLQKSSYFKTTDESNPSFGSFEQERMVNYVPSQQLMNQQVPLQQPSLPHGLVQPASVNYQSALTTSSQGTYQSYSSGEAA